jgi:hypothetical protein
MIMVIVWRRTIAAGAKTTLDAQRWGRVADDGLSIIG